MPQEQEHTTDEIQETRKTILVVEDDEGIGSFLVQAILLETSYHPILARDSSEALHIMQHIKPNLIILDYSLPSMNGLELYDQLIGMDGLAAIPAIVLTASFKKYQTEIEQRELIGLGKPVELDELLETIESAFTRPLFSSQPVECNPAIPLQTCSADETI